MITRIILIIVLFGFTHYSFSQTLKSDQASQASNIILGRIDTVASAILQEARPINVYLPEGYSPDSAATYPVIYLLDGGIDEDFIHIVGLVNYYTTPWIAKFPKSVVIGIQNVNRRRDFTFATANLDFVSRMGFNKDLFKYHSGSRQFIAFIESELQPYVQSHYKVNSSKTIIGESLAGLLASEILLKNPSLFDTYIIASPGLWWGAQSLLNEPTALAKLSSSTKIKVYIAASNKQEDTVMFNDAQRLVVKLKALHNMNVEINYQYLQHETHATILHQAVCNAFKLLYPKSN